MSRYYELTLIIKPEIDDAAAATVVEKITSFIAGEGGKVLKTNQWGMRRLMYPIRKFRDGRYVFNLLELDPNSVARIENRLKLTEDVIRFLFIRADDDLDVSRLTEANPDAQAQGETQAAPTTAAVAATVATPDTSQTPASA